MRYLNQKGMSITEFIVVIAIMAGLAASSIPLFFFLKSHARSQEFDEIVAQLKTRIASWHYHELIENNHDGYPSVLDSQAPGECTQCFEAFLNKPIKNALWLKKQPNHYIFLDAPPGVGEESQGYHLIYRPDTGELVVSKTSP